MATIKKSELTGSINNDIATQQRLSAAGVDGKAMLDGVDADKNGKIEGAERDALWSQIDAYDNDGKASSVSAPKALALVSALRPAVSAGGTIERGAKGEEVKAAQLLLLDLGYYTGEVGADADYGPSTYKAVKLFQGDVGLPATGVIDAATLAKLKAAKPAYPEYGEMFKDGVLRATLAIGFDEDGVDAYERAKVAIDLATRGFAKLTPEELAAQGLAKDATYYTKSFTHDGKPVKVLLRYVDRDTPSAKAQFATGMKNDELVMYGGHGRRGAGPDFDHANSPAGNFVVGVPYEEGHYTLGKNDLDTAGVLSSGYQLMYFNGCNTKLYADDFRTRAGRKGDANLDLILTNTELYWHTTGGNVMSVLDNVMAGSSMPKIKSDLEARNADRSEHGAPVFRADGFRNNVYQPGR